MFLFFGLLSAPRSGSPIWRGLACGACPLSAPISAGCLSELLHCARLNAGIEAGYMLFYHLTKMNTKEQKIKGFLYITGILFLFILVPAGMLISPIFSRLGYGIGAILIYRAFSMKI